MANDETTSDEDAIWVRTEPTPDGTDYMVTIDIDEDRAFSLTEDEAKRYTFLLMEVLARTQYDAAVFGQVKAMVNNKGGDPLPAAAQTVGDLRDRRPPIDFSGYMMWFEGGVNVEGEPFIRLETPTGPIGQWTIAEARGHISGILDAVPTARLDQSYLVTLQEVVGVTEQIARNVVEDLANYRKPEWE